MFFTINMYIYFDYLVFTEFLIIIINVSWDGIGIYLLFNRDGIGIKKGSRDGTRMQPRASPRISHTYTKWHKVGGCLQPAYAKRVQSLVALSL